MLPRLVVLLAISCCLLPAAEERTEPVPRVEAFVLELPSPPAAAGTRQAPPEEVGLALLRQQTVDGILQSEWELRFYGDDTRVLHVERWSHEAPRLVWREWRPGAGRSLIADALPEGVGLVEWGRVEGLRTTLPSPEGVLFPIYLLELARRGELAEGRVPCFDPLSRSVEPLTVRLEFGAQPRLNRAGESVLERRVELRRDDGTSAGSWTFLGDELGEVRWQAGGLTGRRIELPGFEQRLERCAAAGAPESPQR